MNNMKNLIKLHYSSIIALKKTLIILLGLAVFMTVMNKEGSMLPFGASLLIVGLNYNSLAYESNSKSDFLIYSLPVKPKEYILSKYIFGCMNIIISIVFADFLYAILKMLNSISSRDIPMAMINISVITVGIIIIDIVVPIAIVVGFNKARLILIFLAILPVCFSNNIVLLLSKIPVSHINISLGMIQTMIFVIGIIVTVVSYLITFKLYEIKDIN